MSFMGPFLLVLTFIEDALRVWFRWDEQISYMTQHMRYPWWFGFIMLVCSALVQLTGSIMVLAQKYIDKASYLLLGFVVLQPFMYGQMADIDFVCRSLTLAGGLCLLLTHHKTKAAEKQSFPGLPEDFVKKMGGSKVQLLGRTLLTFIFFFQAFRGIGGSDFTVMSVLPPLVLMSLCALVLVGFKARWSGMLLCFLLGLYNVYAYPFWRVSERMRDFYKYYFFQTLSVMGGLLLLVLYGPGGLSMDQGSKKMM